MANLHESLDAARVVVARLKPLLALPEVIEAALQAHEAVRVAAAQKARLQAENDGLELDRARLSDELNSERVAAEAERAERQTQLGELAERLHAARNAAQAEILELELTKRQAIDKAEAEAAARKAELDAEIAAREIKLAELVRKRDEFKALVG